MSRHVPLTAVAPGQTVSVVAIHGGDGVRARLQALGIRPGATICKVTGAAGHGPTVVRHGRAQTALGNGVAGKILVEVTS